MKKLIYLLPIVCILVSCSNLSITKRKYTGGYNVSWSGNKSTVDSKKETAIANPNRNNQVAPITSSIKEARIIDAQDKLIAENTQTSITDTKTKHEVSTANTSTQKFRSLESFNLIKKKYPNPLPEGPSDDKEINTAKVLGIVSLSLGGSSLLFLFLGFGIAGLFAPALLFALGGFVTGLIGFSSYKKLVKKGITPSFSRSLSTLGIIFSSITIFLILIALVLIVAVFGEALGFVFAGI